MLAGGTYGNFTETVFFTGPIATSNFARTTFSGTVIWPRNMVCVSGGYPFTDFKCKKLIMLEGFSGIFHWSAFYYARVDTIVFPSTMPTIPNVSRTGFTRTCKLVINGSNIIPIVAQSYYRPTYNIFAYVPDELVNEYKNEESWQTNFNIDKILPLSEYVED